MAVDTLAKRRSAFTAFLYGHIPGVSPSGSIDAPDRLAAWWGYSGNALSAVTASVGIRYSWRYRYGYIDTPDGQ